MAQSSRRRRKTIFPIGLVARGTTGRLLWANIDGTELSPNNAKINNVRLTEENKAMAAWFEKNINLRAHSFHQELPPVRRPAHSMELSMNSFLQ